MRKTALAIILTSLISAVASTSAFAGTWKQESAGWWYDDEDGMYPHSQWRWLDEDQDGVAECYYFDENGYVLMNGVAPDGNEVNEKGQWVEDGEVMTMYMMVPQPGIGLADEDPGTNGTAGTYALEGLRNVVSGDTVNRLGFMNLFPDGSGSLRLNGSGEGEEKLQWAVDGSKVSVTMPDGTQYSGAIMPEDGQIQITVGDNVYSFSGL